jgi:hypothetical protein
MRGTWLCFWMTISFATFAAQPVRALVPKPGPNLPQAGRNGGWEGRME